MSTEQLLNQAITDKQALVENLVAKGIEATSDETFTTLVPKVNNLIQKFEINDCTYLFHRNSRLNIKDILFSLLKNISTTYNMFSSCSFTEIDVSTLDTSKVTDMMSMFNYCTKLTSLDLSNFNTSKVTNMQSMFYGCNNLISLDLSSFDTSKVTNMSNMFQGCGCLTSLDLSNFNTSNVTTMNSMFYSVKLTTLDLSNFDTNKVTNMANMFWGNTNLSNLKIKINATTSLSSCPLTSESVNWILNNINTVTGSKTLTLGATNLANASEEALAVATGRGWTVN